MLSKLSFLNDELGSLRQVHKNFVKFINSNSQKRILVNPKCLDVLFLQSFGYGG